MAADLTWTSFYQQHYDTEEIVAEYFTPDSEYAGDAVHQPRNQIYEWCISAAPRWDTLIQYGLSHFLPAMWAPCDFVKQIIIIDFLDNSVQYVQKWLKRDLESFYPSQTSKDTAESQEEWKKLIVMEEKMRQMITQVIQADLAEYGPVAPKGVPQADVLLCPCTLCFLCKDKESFIRSAKDMASLLKVGGYLLMHVPIECTFFYMNEIKFPMLYIKEDFVLRVLCDHGFTIKEVQKNPRISTSKLSRIDWPFLLFVVACKESVVQ